MGNFTAQDGRKIELGAGHGTSGCFLCGEVFTAVTNFDKHRKNNKCVNPKTVGLEKNERGYWRIPDTSGRWDDAE